MPICGGRRNTRFPPHVGFKEAPLEKRGKNRKKRADLLLIGALVLLAGALFLWQLASRSDGAVVAVYVDGERTASYPLDADTTVTLYTPDGGSYNVLVISGGTADVTDAGCPDKLCVHMGAIRRDGEAIICLPNRTVIQIEGGETSGVDVG